MPAVSSTPSEPASVPEVAHPIDTSVLSELARRFLIDALTRIPGPKTLVLDPAIAGSVGLVADVGMLKLHGVDRMYYLEPGGPLSNAQPNVVYLCSASPKLMRVIAGQIKAMQGGRYTYTLLMAPRITNVCTAALQDEGVYGSIDVVAYPLELVPLERDLLSLEVDDSYKSIFLDHDYSAIFDMARALMTVQRAYGLIPRIAGKGDAAQRLADLLVRLRRELPATAGPSSELLAGPIDSLVIIDRSVDMITPLCTQLTYEGLVDEFVGIRNAHVEVDPNLVNPPPTALPSPSTALTSIPAMPKRKRMLLTASNDALFGELRDKNFAVVGSILNRVAKRINADYENRHKAQTVTEIRDFVGRLGTLQAEHQALRLHTGLTEQIMQTTMTDEFNRGLEIQQNMVAGIDLALQENGIRDLLAQEVPLRSILRLLSIYSLVTGGLKPKVFEELKRDILQTYGYDYLPLIMSLDELGLVTKQSTGRSAFATCRKPFRLIVDEVDEHVPEDVSYVYSGYAPLSVRLVQCTLSSRGSGFNGWRGSMEDTVRSLPGKTFEMVQHLDDAVKARTPAVASSDQPAVTVVCFLGGCTYTEVSALRFVSQRNPGRKILIATTGIVNGSNLLSSLMPVSLAAL